MKRLFCLFYVRSVNRIKLTDSDKLLRWENTNSWRKSNNYAKRLRQSLRSIHFQTSLRLEKQTLRIIIFQRQIARINKKLYQAGPNETLFTHRLSAGYRPWCQQLVCCTFPSSAQFFIWRRYKCPVHKDFSKSFGFDPLNWLRVDPVIWACNTSGGTAAFFYRHQASGSPIQWLAGLGLGPSHRWQGPYGRAYLLGILIWRLRRHHMPDEEHEHEHCDDQPRSQGENEVVRWVPARTNKRDKSHSPPPPQKKKEKKTTRTATKQTHQCLECMWQYFPLFSRHKSVFRRARKLIELVIGAPLETHFPRTSCKPPLVEWNWLRWDYLFTELVGVWKCWTR